MLVELSDPADSASYGRHVALERWVVALLVVQLPRGLQILHVLVQEDLEAAGDVQPWELQPGQRRGWGRVGGELQVNIEAAGCSDEYTSNTLFFVRTTVHTTHSK